MRNNFPEKKYNIIYADPPLVRDKIVELCGDVPRIELFARQKAEGWDSWGKEVAWAG